MNCFITYIHFTHRKWVETWKGTRKNSQKYVYEEVGIGMKWIFFLINIFLPFFDLLAAFLICLDRIEKKEKSKERFSFCLRKKKLKIYNRPTTFVDLGCGNGFLVYLLTSEGFVGHGIDLNEVYLQQIVFVDIIKKITEKSVEWL